jgi:hypothetical protein
VYDRLNVEKEAKHTTTKSKIIIVVRRSIVRSLMLYYNNNNEILNQVQDDTASEDNSLFAISYLQNISVFTLLSPPVLSRDGLPQ